MQKALNYRSSRPFLNYGTAEVFALGKDNLVVVKIFQKCLAETSVLHLKLIQLLIHFKHSDSVLKWVGFSLLINKKHQALRGKSFSYLCQHILHDPEICSGNGVIFQTNNRIFSSLGFMSVCQGSHLSIFCERKSTKG